MRYDHSVPGSGSAIDDTNSRGTVLTSGEIISIEKKSAENPVKPGSCILIDFSTGRTKIFPSPIFPCGQIRR